MSFDFSAVRSPFRMQPGLRRLPQGALHLTPNTLDSRPLREKLQVLLGHPSQALCIEPGFDASPVLDALISQGVAEHPSALARDAVSVLAPHLGWSLRGTEPWGDGPPGIGACLAALAPEWRLAGLLCLAFAEDFAVIEADTARIPWLAVCLPSRWAPEEKIGRHFAQVHAPVADNDLLIAAGDHLARLVTGADRWERFVWSIVGEPGLQLHPMHSAPSLWKPELDASDTARAATFRTERQTFMPLPERGQSIFTIRIDSAPLVQAVDSPQHAGQLHDALASMTPAVLAYRGLGEVRDRLLEWLADRSTGPA